jgi:hypothetical protein
MAALKNYREYRENGTALDQLKAFPAAGVDALKIQDSTYKPHGRNKESYWPDKEGRYWWRLTLKDGSVIDNYYWMKDKVRGYPDTNKNYWFSVHHAPSGAKIEGFSARLESLDKDGPYWFYIQYDECGHIKEWIEEKDRNFCVRTGKFLFLVPFKLNTFNNVEIPKGLIPYTYNFRCPITQKIMLEPVMAADGHTYEREAILQALEKRLLSPMTGQPIESKAVIPNNSIRSMICDFLTKHPECWQEVYVSTAAINELLVLSSGDSSLNLQKWESILRTDPRLLTLPLHGVTILEFLCKQTESIVKTYLPALLNLLTPKDWQYLIIIYSAQDWLKLVAQTCERCAATELAAEFLNKLQTSLGIKEINPLEMALYALEQRHRGLFKLALSQLKDVNVPVDVDKNTLLHLAARQGQTEMIQSLVNHGAHLKQRNATGLKAEGVARLSGFEATADQIAVLKLAPVLERMGIFPALRRLETLEDRLGCLEASAGASAKPDQRPLGVLG